jgi:hypothetical protein
MKTIIGIIAMCISSQVMAQEPETVLSIVQDRKQFDLWEKELDKDGKRPDAWYNYYMATRALRNLTFDEERKRHNEKCHQIAKAAYEAIPNSFEANHLIWKDGGNDSEKISFLMKAAEIAPNDSRTFGDLMIHYELNRNQAKFSEMCKKLSDVNELPASILNWAYNVLAGLDENAIIFTAGDNDTYALWMIQGAKNFRTDVMVINTHLAAMADYRSKLLQELEMPKLPEGEEMIFKHFFENSGDKSVYVAVSAIKQFDNEDIKKKLYLTGLEYKYSEDGIDNMSIIRRNYEKRYLLDYLGMQFTTHVADKVAENFEPLYLPSLVKLLMHYRSTEETQKADTISKILDKIGAKTDQDEYIQKLLKDC